MYRGGIPLGPIKSPGLRFLRFIRGSQVCFIYSLDMYFLQLLLLDNYYPTSRQWESSEMLLFQDGLHTETQRGPSHVSHVPGLFPGLIFS